MRGIHYAGVARTVMPSLAASKTRRSKPGGDRIGGSGCMNPQGMILRQAEDLIRPKTAALRPHECGVSGVPAEYAYHTPLEHPAAPIDVCPPPTRRGHFPL